MSGNAPEANKHLSMKAIDAMCPTCFNLGCQHATDVAAMNALAEKLNIDPYPDRSFDDLVAEKYQRFSDALHQMTVRADRAEAENAALLKENELMHMAICDAVTHLTTGYPHDASIVLRTELVRVADAALLAGKKP